MKEKQLVQDSFDRCLTSSPFFIYDFYFTLFQKHDSLIKLFESVDFIEQEKHLKTSLRLLVVYCDNSQEFKENADSLIQLHKNLNLSKEHYNIFTEIFIEVAEKHDEQYNSETKKAWQQVLSEGCKSFYNN